MSEDEKLKQEVLSRCAAVWAQAIGDSPYVFPAVGDYTLSKDRRNVDWTLDYYKSGSIYYSFSERYLASDPVWRLVAPILGIGIQDNLHPPLA